MHRCLTTLAVVALVAPELFGGMDFGAGNTTFRPGTEVIDVKVVNETTSTTWNNIFSAGFFELSLDSAGVGSPPFFTSGTPNSYGLTPNTAGGWNGDLELLGQVSFQLPNNAPAGPSTVISLAPGQMEKIADVSVTIPASFQGTFDIILDQAPTLADPDGFSATVFGGANWLNDAAVPGAGTRFRFTVVPEPNAFLLVGLIGLALGGYNWLGQRRRKT